MNFSDYVAATDQHRGLNASAAMRAFVHARTQHHSTFFKLQEGQRTRQHVATRSESTPAWRRDDRGSVSSHSLHELGRFTDIILLPRTKEIVLITPYTQRQPLAGPQVSAVSLRPPNRLCRSCREELRGLLLYKQTSCLVVRI